MACFLKPSPLGTDDRGILSFGSGAAAFWSFVTFRFPAAMFLPPRMASCLVAPQHASDTVMLRCNGAGHAPPLLHFVAVCSTLSTLGPPVNALIALEIAAGNAAARTINAPPSASGLQPFVRTTLAAGVIIRCSTSWKIGTKIASVPSTNEVSCRVTLAVLRKGSPDAIRSASPLRPSSKNCVPASFEKMRSASGEQHKQKHARPSCKETTAVHCRSAPTVPLLTSGRNPARTPILMVAPITSKRKLDVHKLVPFTRKSTEDDRWWKESAGDSRLSANGAARIRSVRFGSIISVGGTLKAPRQRCGSPRLVKLSETQDRPSLKLLTRFNCAGASAASRVC